MGSNQDQLERGKKRLKSRQCNVNKFLEKIVNDIVNNKKNLIRNTKNFNKKEKKNKRRKNNSCRFEFSTFLRSNKPKGQREIRLRSVADWNCKQRTESEDSEIVFF